MEPSETPEQVGRPKTLFLMRWSVGPDGRLGCQWQVNSALDLPEKSPLPTEPVEAPTWFSIAS